MRMSHVFMRSAAAGVAVAVAVDGAAGCDTAAVAVVVYVDGNVAGVAADYHDVLCC